MFSFSSSWPLVSTQLSVSSAWRLAQIPNPKAIQTMVPTTSKVAAAIRRVRTGRLSEPAG